MLWYYYLSSKKSNGAKTKLLRVGPYASNPVVPVNSLSSLSLDFGNLVLDQTSTRTSPYKINALNLTNFSSIAPNLTNQSCVYLWANTITIDGTSVIQADGSPGFDGISGSLGGSPAQGGDAGGGASGGGGGASSDGIDYAGGVGASGVNGANGSASGVHSFPGVGGAGTGTLNIDGGFAYGLGGNGAASLGGAAGGSGALGFGGGGGGGSAFGTLGPYCAGGGGGAGAATVSIVCQSLISLGGTGTFSAMGGAGGNEAGSAAYQGGPGGNGILWIATMKKQGTFNFNISGNGAGDGLVKLYEILADQTTLVPHLNLNDSW